MNDVAAADDDAPGDDMLAQSDSGEWLMVERGADSSLVAEDVAPCTGSPAAGSEES